MPQHQTQNNIPRITGRIFLEYDSYTMNEDNDVGKYVKLVSAEGQEFFLDKEIAMVRCATIGFQRRFL